MRIIIILSLLMFGCVTPDYGNYTPIPTTTERYYDKKGSYTGYSIKNKYQTRYYDKRGNFIGSSKGE